MSQPSTEPEMPKLLESLLIRILWSMVSKAALRSNELYVCEIMLNTELSSPRGSFPIRRNQIRRILKST